MPAQILDRTTPSSHDRGDVIGVYADPKNDPESKLNTDAVAHIALLARSMNLKYGDKVDVHHMGGTRLDGTRLAPHEIGSCVAHIVGHIDGITQKERSDLIAVVADELKDLETRMGPLSLGYRVLPHFSRRNEPKTGVLLAVKCSCVGLAVHAIEHALNRDILDHKDPKYVETTLDVLEQIYPPKLLSNRRRAGLAGGGPWRVVLPGHLLHALNEPPNSPPFRPGPNHYLYT